MLAPLAVKAGAKAAERLPMDLASRMARAAEQGYRLDMPVYHGSGAEFTSPRAVPTTAAGMKTPGVSVALDPRVASEFAVAQRDSEPGNPQVYPLLHRAENPAILTLDGTEKHGEVVGALRDAFEAGHDAVMLKNYTTPAGLKGQKIIIVKSGDQLRSPQAAFDPARKFDANLLAGIAGMAVVPAAGLAVAVDYDPFQ